MKLNFNDVTEADAKPAWLVENESELESIMVCTIKWALTNYKKKVSKAAIKRLQVLLDNVESFYSLCLFAPSLLTMHALELVGYALTAKSDEDFLEKISDFTTVEECGMLMTFFFDNEYLIKDLPKLLTFCHDLNSFISSITGEEIDDKISIADTMEKFVADLKGPMKELNDILLTEDYHVFVNSAVGTMKEALDADLLFTRVGKASGLEDITYTLLVAIVNILISKLASFPVLRDVCGIGRALTASFRCPERVTSQKEAEEHTARMRSSKTSVEYKVNDIIGRLAIGFTDNATVSMLPIKMSSDAEFRMLSNIYNESGLIIEEHKHEPRQAEWSLLCVGFYNALAEHYADKEWVHVDNADELSTGLHGKVDTNRVDNIAKNVGVSQHEDVVVKLGYSIVAGIEDADDEEKPKKVKKKRVPKKKI